MLALTPRPPLPHQSQTVSVSRPPVTAPQRLPERRPRTRTAGDIFGASTELTSSSERSFEDSSQSQGTVSLTSSVEVPLHKSSEVTKPLPPPPVSAKPGKAKLPPPPKPKPFPLSGQSLCGTCAYFLHQWDGLLTGFRIFMS